MNSSFAFLRFIFWIETITNSPAELPEKINNTRHMCSTASWRQGHAVVVWVMDKQSLRADTIPILFIVRFSRSGPLHLVKDNLFSSTIAYTLTLLKVSIRDQMLELNDRRREIRTLPRWRRRRPWRWCAKESVNIKAGSNTSRPQTDWLPLRCNAMSTRFLYDQHLIEREVD